MTYAVLIGRESDGKRQQGRRCSSIHHGRPGGCSETGGNHVSGRAFMDTKRRRPQGPIAKISPASPPIVSQNANGIMAEILHCHLQTRSLIFMCSFSLFFGFFFCFFFMFLSWCPAQGEPQLLWEKKRKSGTAWWRLENCDNESEKIHSATEGKSFKKWMYIIRTF